jgi:membrane protein YqaA with SNARE-associated domain
MDPTVSLWALFTSSFLAATLLPGGSELVLYGVLTMHPNEKWSAIAVATLGNTLGGLTSYAIGRIVPRPRTVKGVEAVERYGAPVLLFSWVPFIGDPLCLAAGWLRMNALLVTVYMAAGKLARYVAVAAVAT